MNDVIFVLVENCKKEKEVPQILFNIVK